MRKSKYSICLLLSAALCAGMFYGCSHGGATSSDGDSGGGETSEQQALVGKYSTVWTQPSTTKIMRTEAVPEKRGLRSENFGCGRRRRNPHRSLLRRTRWRSNPIRWQRPSFPAGIKSSPPHAWKFTFSSISKRRPKPTVSILPAGIPTRLSLTSMQSGRESSISTRQRH